MQMLIMIAKVDADVDVALNMYAYAAVVFNMDVDVSTYISPAGHHCFPLLSHTTDSFQHS